MINRRRVLKAGALLGAAAGQGVAAPAETLAVDGGAPVRATPLTNSYWGTSFYGEEERGQLQEVLETRSPFRWYGPGTKAPGKVATFEREFAARMQTKFALAVTSGTAALQCAVAALGVGPGDEVILPSWTWHSCFNAVVLAGGLPVCAEIDESFNLDPSDIERHITAKTKAIMAVHLQGTPCHLDKILAIARKHKLKVLEDCAQSVGGSYRGKPLGSHGDIGIYSLQLNKSITAGEGGAVVTNDPALFERAARFHDMGGLRPAHQAITGTPASDWFIGANYRMNEFSGGVLLAQVRKLDRIVNAVRTNARRVVEGIQDLPGIRMRQSPDTAGDLWAGVFLGFAGQQQRDRFMAAMKAEGVPARPPGGSVILPLQKHIQNKVTHHPDWPSFTSERGRAMRYGPETCPKTIDILNRFAGVSMDPKHTAADTADIVRAIRKVYVRATRS
jgi:8-amino-3,8-dideoxy-alpha-D-manno-octulosonate transaminase